jgi:hypothetical protein
MWQQCWRRRLWRGASGSDMADGQLIHHLLFNKLPRILTAAVGPFRRPLRSALAGNTSCRQQQPDGNVALLRSRFGMRRCDNMRACSCLKVIYLRSDCLHARCCSRSLCACDGRAGGQDTVRQRSAALESQQSPVHNWQRVCCARRRKEGGAMPSSLLLPRPPSLNK